jgi:hypothetical protein
VPACQLHLDTMLRRLHKQAVEEGDGKLQRKKSKRQRIVHFFRSKGPKSQSDDGAAVAVRSHPPGATVWAMLKCLAGEEAGGSRHLGAPESHQDHDTRCSSL